MSAAVPKLRWTRVRIANWPAIYGLAVALGAVLYLSHAPLWTAYLLLLAGAPLFFYDPDDEFGRLFWVQIAHHLRGRQIMRAAIERLLGEQTPPALSALIEKI